MTAPSPPAPARANPAPAPRIIITLVVAVAFLMEHLDSTIVTTAIPAMARTLGTLPVRLNLAVTAYVLMLAVFIPLSGWLADRFGARRVFVLALLTFTIASALCGAVQSLDQLVAARILQGIGGAMMTPVGRLVLIRSFPRADLVTAMTYTTLPALVGPLIGPLLGGVLTTYLSWRWIFYVNLPFGLLGIALALRFVEPRPGDPTLAFDLFGFLLVGAGIGLLQIGIENLGRPTLPVLGVAALLGGAAALLFGFVRRTRGRPVPALDLRLFRLRGFAVGTLAGGLARIGLNATPFLLPLMFQVGFGMSPIASGSLVFLGSAGSMALRAVIGRLLRRFGFAQVLVGTSILGAALLASFSLVEADTPRWLIGSAIFVYGVVRSTQLMSSNMLSYADMPDERLSQATSLFGVLQQLTVSFGVALAAMLLGIVSGHAPHLTPGDFHTVFRLVALLPLAAVPGFLRLHPEDGVAVSGFRPEPSG